MEPLSTIFLFIAILALFAAWALRLTEGDPLDTGDMGPESVLQHGIPPMENERFGKRRAVLDLPVRHVPPVALPAPAPEPKRRRKPSPQPKRETKPDTRKVERKGR